MLQVKALILCEFVPQVSGQGDRSFLLVWSNLSCSPVPGLFLSSSQHLFPHCLLFFCPVLGEVILFFSPLKAYVITFHKIWV